MSVSHIDSGKQLRVQSPCTQSTRNSTCNLRLGERCIYLICQSVRLMNFARLFACKAQTNNAQFKDEELDVTIRQNLEVLGYGE